MTITLDVKPETREQLARQAAVSGKPLEVHAAALLEVAASQSNEQTQSVRSMGLVEVCAMVRGLTDDLDFSRNPSAGRPVNIS